MTPTILQPGQNVLSIGGPQVMGARSLGPPPLHILDHFTGTDGTLLTAHAPDINTPGGTWGALGGMFSIQGNRIAETASAAIAAIETSNSDLTTKLTVIMPSANSFIGPIVRCVDSTHYWMAIIWKTNNTFALFESNGGLTQRASQSVSVPSGVDIPVSYVVSGSSHTAVALGKILTYSSSLFGTATKCGMTANISSSTGYMDDFEVTP